MTLTEKLSSIQQKMKASKNKYNSFGNYKYRNAEDILEAFKPFEAAYKVAVTITDDIVDVGNRIYVKAVVTLHDCEADQSISVSAYAREAESKKGMDDSQITGTASSYARKYALSGLLLLDDTKDADTDEYQMQQDDRPASDSQKKTIEAICLKHGIDYKNWCKTSGTTWEKLTSNQAGVMLQALKKKYKDD